MRPLDFLVVVPLLIVPAALWQCSSQTPAAPGQDAGPEASTGDDDDANGDDSLGDDDSGPTINCNLGYSAAMPSDPVSLCFQKQVIEFVHKSVVTPTGGVAASWDSTSLLPTSDGGTVLHDWRDDAAFGSAIADYINYASKYGDNQISPDIYPVLAQIAIVLEGELATLPDEYDGEPYMHLRNVAAGLNFISDMTDATAIDAIADAYGRAIATTYLHPLGGAGDAIVGRCSAPGVCTYETEKVATAALAMLDLAWRSTFTDAGIPVNIDGSAMGLAPAALTSAATAVLTHLERNAASPTGMYYRALVTGGASTDAGGADGGTSGDAPVVIDTWPADALLVDVQATTLFALLRAAALVTAEPVLSAAANYPFFSDVNAIYAGMHGSPSLWDTTGGGYFEAYVPSTGALYMDKPSGPNGIMYGALNYNLFENAPTNVEAGAPQVTELSTERTLLTQTGAMNASLITVLANQQAFLRASSASFGLATSYAADGGPGPTEPGASNYVSASTSAVLEGLSAQAFGVNDLQ
jgi:hypothetical protein